MKQPRLLITVIFLFILIFPYCSKTDNPQKSKVYTPEYVTATISGRITDNEKLPVNGAFVKAGTATATTGSDGTFMLQNVTIDKHSAFVKVEKVGFFLGTKTFVASAGQTNQVTIQLIRKTVAGTINASSGGTVTVPSSGGTITFANNGIVNAASNSAYTGTVEVSAFFINPDAPDFTAIMPGTLRGITSSNEETGLQSFGMMAVELTGAAGEKLQLAPGKSATIHFPIPAGLQNEAPATIPLWSLDETTGLWKEEGKATREGKEYVGTVSHFSFWNCDAPFPLVDFSATIKDQQNNTINGVEVVIELPKGSSTAGSISGNGFTSADGLIHGKLPANKVMQLKIYNKCRQLLHSQDIGPFSSTTDLGAIKINYTSSQVTISGTVSNCNNEPVDNGIVTIMLEDLYYNIPFTNGSFTTTISRCNNNATTASLTAFDLVNQSSGKEEKITVSSSNPDAVSLSACGVSAGMYIRYTVEGVHYELIPPSDTLQIYTASQNNFIAIGGKKKGSAEDNIVLIFKNTGQTGAATLYVTDIRINESNVLYNKTAEHSVVEINEYGDAGGFIGGTIAGAVRDSMNTKVVPFNCRFRVKR